LKTCESGARLFVVRTSLHPARSDECLLKPSSSSTDEVAELVQRTIDLSGCADGSVEIHPLHGSVLGQQHCFLVSTRAGNTYFACRTDDERREWMEQYVMLMFSTTMSFDALLIAAANCHKKFFTVRCCFHAATVAGRSR